MEYISKKVAAYGQFVLVFMYINSWVEPCVEHSNYFCVPFHTCAFLLLNLNILPYTPALLLQNVY